LSGGAATAVSRYAASNAGMARARRTLAGGVATAMRAGQRPTPLVMSHGAGSRMWDLDGNEYVDYVLGFGPLLLGHSPPGVVAAVEAQLRRGLTFGAQHELEAELAELLVDLIPCAEQVCFSSTGSEAVQAALRIARAATGRRITIKFEGHYHGWLDPVHVSTPGLPPDSSGRRGPLPPIAGTGGQLSARDDVLVARWNDERDLKRILAAYGGDVAAVIMEPVACNGGVIPPRPGYLAAVRRLTESAGALLVFDDVVTGFRLALGGAQERYGVQPDLAVYGKAIAAGMPLSAVTGRRDVMSVVADGRVRHVGTFNCSPPAAAGAVAAVSAYRAGSPELYERLETMAAQLAAGLRKAAAAAGVPLLVNQVGPLVQTFVMDPHDEVASYPDTARSDAEALAVFAGAMVDRGVMVLPRGWWFLSTEHTQADLELTLAAARESFASIRELLPA
jgi:glutamate-1-semialdehyde 2,1-aminomutase